MFQVEQEQHEENDPWEMSIRAYLEDTTYERIQAVTIMAECLLIPVERRNRAVIGRVNGILRNIDGWEEMKNHQRIKWRELDGYLKGAQMKNVFQRVAQPTTQRKLSPEEKTRPLTEDEWAEIQEREAIRMFGG